MPHEIPSRDLAGLLDLTPQRIAQLVAAGIVPKTRHGFVAFPAAVHAYISARIASIDNERSGESALDFERWRKISSANDIAEGETMTAVPVVDLFERIGAALSAELTAVADTVDLKPAAKDRLKSQLRLAIARIDQRRKRASESILAGDELDELIDWGMSKTEEDTDDDESESDTAGDD